MESISFSGQCAIVTGAGSGLGRGYALELARRGASVVVNDVAVEAVDGVVAEIERAGGRATASHETVATPEGGRAIVETALEHFGRVDAVINNAGFVGGGAFAALEPDGINELLQVHVGAVFYVTQPAWRAMREQGYGRVVLSGSTGGVVPMQANSAYTAAKAAVHGLGRALGFEGREHGILVNTVLPSAPTNIVPAPRYEERFAPGVLEALAPRRTVESVAALVAFLASSACTLSGETISAVAGRYARVFAGITEGWVADSHRVSAEDVAAHVDEIVARDAWYEPADFYDEMAVVARRTGGSSGTGRDA